MSGKLLSPLFLTKTMAENAIGAAVDAAQSNRLGVYLKHNMCHVVILVPAMNDGGGVGYPNYPIQPHLLAELGFGEKEKWPHDFSNIAQCKALQLWHNRNDGGTDVKPHLLFSGDTPFWGGVKRDGIVVACSGVQPWFDRMIAGMTADVCIALAYNAWMKSLDKAKGVDFVTDMTPAS